MARSGSMTYDPQTGKWKKSGGGESSSSSSSNKSGGSSSKSGSSSGGKNSSKKSGDNLTSSSSSKNTSSGKVEKQYNYIEMNTLSGTLSFIVNEETIKLKAGETVKLNGLGKYLSGNYYVKDITRNISSNGYSHSATLIRTDVGDSLKSSTKSKNKKKPVKPPKPAVKKEKPTPSKKTATRTYTVKRGDCLWNIAKKFYGSGTAWQKIYNANTSICGRPYTKGGTTYVLIYPGQVLTIP